MKNYLIFSFILGAVFFGSITNSFAEIESVDVVENKLVTLIGEGYDSDAEDLNFLWTQTYGEPVILSSNSIPEPTFMAPEVQNGDIKVLTFELKVTDPLGASNSDIVEVIVNPVNNIPTVDAGRDQVAFPTIHAMTIIPTVVDVDEDNLTYKWENVSGQNVVLQYTDKKHLTFFPMSIDHTKVEPITFQITVDDGFGGIASDEVNVFSHPNLLDNKRISIQTGPIQTVTEGDPVTMTVTGSTADNSPISYFWVQLLGPSVTLSSLEGDAIQFVAPEVGESEKLLSFQVSGHSPGNGWANALGMVKVLPSNSPPIADAGDDQNVRENVLVKLEGTGTDPDNDKLRYSWVQKSGKEIELYERSSFSVYFFSPDIQSSTEQLVFELTVTDNHGNSDTDTANVNINVTNSPPRAFAGNDKRVTSEAQVTIAGSGVDVDGDELKFEWTQISGTPVSFDKSKPTITFTAPEVLSPRDSKRIALQLTVTDPDGQSDSDQVVIFVSPENSPPRVNVGADMTADENTVIDLTCSGTDPDGDRLDYLWTSSSPRIEIMQINNPITAINIPSIVFDTTVTITCAVSDGVYSVSDSMNLTIRNTLSLDIVADAGIDRIVNENIRTNLDASKSFDPEDQKLAYKWTQISGEEVALSSTTAATPSFTSPTVENNEIKVLIFELRVYDDNGREDFDTVTFTVDPINSPPEASASAKQ